MKQTSHIRELINRLARLDAATAWGGDLNPTQRAVLDYLGRANRFSRSPSHVAEYLGTTRGTVSQSFKSLVQKSYVTEHRSKLDKRAISFELTETGKTVASVENPLAVALDDFSEGEKDNLLASLKGVLGAILSQNKGRPFGICSSCTHHETTSDGGYCTLLSEALLPFETHQICFEQETS
ncbi:MarR family winged helix-turn-helix transcriptional regulator [Litoreibacter halocynthiae]|uniref:MarR family winged helix-turn-helix transcriptional regulator n=1 Tax=Litoreibacter halocynthiae TaxID=1242689 RepID=UPI00249061D8|nr:MarR family winged helix-turn-helix transcriptional regulator [Litoreibacter halocynthiae]